MAKGMSNSPHYALAMPAILRAQPTLEPSHNWSVFFRGLKEESSQNTQASETKWKKKKEGEKNQVARKQGKNKMLPSWAPSNKTIHCADSLNILSCLTPWWKSFTNRRSVFIWYIYIHTVCSAGIHIHVGLRPLTSPSFLDNTLDTHGFHSHHSVTSHEKLLHGTFTVFVTHCISKSCFMPTPSCKYLSVYTPCQLVNIYWC